LNGKLREALRVQSNDENETIKKVLWLDDGKFSFKGLKLPLKVRRHFGSVQTWFRLGLNYLGCFVLKTVCNTPLCVKMMRFIPFGAFYVQNRMQHTTLFQNDEIYSIWGVLCPKPYATHYFVSK